MLIDLIAGARPNFMKIASIIQAIEKRAEKKGARAPPKKGAAGPPEHT